MSSSHALIQTEAVQMMYAMYISLLGGHKNTVESKKKSQV